MPVDIRFRLTPEEFQALLRRMSTVEIGNRLAAGMRESAEFLRGETQKRMDDVDTGISRGSIFSDLRGAPINIASLQGVVGSPEVSVFVMETGRRTGQAAPPIGPIQDWLHRHGISERFAWVVSRAIARRGLWQPDGNRQFERAALENIRRVNAILTRRFLGL